MNRIASWVISILLCVVFSSAFAYPNDNSVESIVGFFEELELPQMLDDFAVKGNQPQLFNTYSKRHVTAYAGRGKRKDSDILSSPQRTMLAMLTSPTYRFQAKLLYVDKNARLGFLKSRFVSLQQFDEQVMPILRRAVEQGDAGLSRIAMEIVSRAELIASQDWDSLPIFPPATGREWRSARDFGDHSQAMVMGMRQALQANDSSMFGTELERLLLLTSETNPANGLPDLNRSLERITTEFNLSAIAFWLLLLASLAYFVRMALRVKFLAPLGLLLSILGTLLLLVTLIMRAILAGHLPVTSLYEYLSLTALMVLVAYLFFYLFTRQVILGALANPVALLLMVAASLFPSEIEAQLVPALQSFWLEIHVILAALGEGAFAIAAVCSVMYLVLRNAKPRPDGSLPNIEMLDMISYRSIAIGYPLFTIGALVAGAIWAEIAWGAWWSWDPKETGAFVVWILASLYLHARLNRGWRGTKTAVLAILIFVFAILTLFSNLIVGGLHSYGVN